jgi:prepilin-type N-terminal cleavage/methylation domain-containing protein
MREQLKRRRSEEGFTLIELLIVIIILAILATIVIFAVGSTTKNAAEAACKSTLRTVQTAVAAYNTQVGTYPKKLATLKTTTVVTTTTVGPWLKSIPATTSTKNKNYWFTAAIGKTGQVKLETKGSHAAPLTGTTTANACKTA